MGTRQCESCGATMELPPEALSTTCAFCDSPLVDATADEEPVDRVVSFQIDRDGASRLLARHLARQLLAPEALRRAASPTSLRAVLVPFYAFDAETESDWSARVGIHWWRTETYTVIVDGKPVQRTRRVQETDWHDLSGSHVGQWLDHLVSASRGLPEAEANALEPFDLGHARPWSPALVAGLLAERPVVDHATAEATARSELQERVAAVIRSEHLPGDTSSGVQCRTRIELQGFRLVLLPVWVGALGAPSGDELRLLVNGQTGEVVGRVPVSRAKVAGLVAAGLLLLLVLLCGFGVFR